MSVSTKTVFVRRKRTYRGPGGDGGLGGWDGWEAPRSVKEEKEPEEVGVEDYLLNYLSNEQKRDNLTNQTFSLSQKREERSVTDSVTDT